MSDRVTPDSREAARLIEQREALAALAHKQWSGWMHYLFGKSEMQAIGGIYIPREWFERWQRQANTPYAELSEAEKDSDRQEADRVLALLADVLGSPSEKDEELAARVDEHTVIPPERATAAPAVAVSTDRKPDVSYSAPLKFDGSEVARAPEPASDFALCSRHGRMACQECRREGYSVHISNLSKTQIECVFCKDRGLLPSEAIACFAHSEGYIRDVLLAHWPLLQCDHEAKTDTAICACGERIEPQPSVQLAIEAWVNHLFGEVHDHAAALRLPEAPVTSERQKQGLRRLDTPENRAYWEAVRRAAEEWETSRPEWSRIRD